MEYSTDIFCTFGKVKANGTCVYEEILDACENLYELEQTGCGF